MSKNGNGEGSIYEHKRNGKKVGYRGAYWVHTAEGPKRRYVQGKTRAEVNHKLTKAMADKDGGFIFDAGSLSVGEYLERWLEDSVRGTVRPSTFEGHKHMVRPVHSPGSRPPQAQRPQPQSRPWSLPREAGLRTLRGYGAQDAQHPKQGTQANSIGWTRAAQRLRSRQATES